MIAASDRAKAWLTAGREGKHGPPTGAHKKEQGTMSATTEENKRIIRRLVDEVLNGGDLALIDELFDPAYLPYDTSNPGRGGGIAGAREFIAPLHQAGLTDVRYLVEGLMAEGDLVAYRWTLHFVHTGPLMGIPATGRPVSITGADIFHLADGRIVESWVYPDALGMLQQLGVLPPMGRPLGGA